MSVKRSYELYKLDERWIRPVLNVIFQSDVHLEGDRGQAELYLVIRGGEAFPAFTVRNPTSVISALLRLFPDVGVVMSRVRKDVGHEFKTALYHILAQRAEVIEGEIDSALTVHPAVLMPIYFGPTRYGLAWARVAAGAAYYAFEETGCVFDLGTTIKVLRKIVGILGRKLEEYSKLSRHYGLEVTSMAETPRIEAGGHGGDVKGAWEYICPTSEGKIGDEVVKWLLNPIAAWGDPGKYWHALANYDKVVVVATEAFSPYHLHLLRCAEKIYLIYTPNVYLQVKYALSNIKQNNVERVLASSYNPHINYAIFKKMIQDAVYHPKLAGPAPIYLALKKLEAEGFLSKVM